MNVKSDEERKSKRIKIHLSDSEYAKLKRYTAESGLRSMSEYIYRSVLATPIVHISGDELAPHFKRLKVIADHINAIAFRVNQTDKIYPEDLQEIKQGIVEIHDKLAEYHEKLDSLAVTPKTFKALIDKAHREAKNKL
ncbi:MAG: hypothetical protein J6M48_11340 [Ruminococcus sp.]|nr:hypothetical protein [Ruminococcus sp.]